MRSSATSTELREPQSERPEVAEARFVEPRHRTLRALIAATLVIGLLGVGAARDGAKRAEQLKCWGTLRNTAKGDAWQCERQAERWLGIASLLPWTRPGAERTRDDLRIRAAELELFVATRGQPSRVRRSVAVTRLLERSPELAPAASAALQSGAYGELLTFVDSRRPSLDPMSRDLALSAALLEVNPGALRGLLSSAPGRRLSAEPRRTAALACALLAPAAARPWLDSLSGAHPDLIEACGGAPHPQALHPETPAEDRLGELALALARLSTDGPRAQRALQALRLVAPPSTHPETTRLEPPRWYSPSDVLKGLSVNTSGAALDTAARQLDEILARDAQAIDLRAAAAGADPSALIFPRETLERARLALRLHAFALGLRRGETKIAVRQLELAAAQAPHGFELSLAAAHLALREPRAALKLNREHAQRFGDSTSLEETTQRRLQQAYAENELGDRAAAFVAVRRAKQLCDAAQAATEPQPLAADGAATVGSGPDGCADVEWALASTSIAARQLQQLPEPLDLNGLITGDIHVDTGGLALWRSLAVAPEAARRPLRVRLRRPALSGRWQAFGYQLVGEVTRGSGDVDVWLDAAAGQHRPGDLLSYFTARASAARWRGDAAAERAWAARSERAAALASDDTASYLLTQAGY